MEQMMIKTECQPSELAATMTTMRDMMAAMAEMLRTTNERMGELERQVRAMTKVTPAQAKAINDAIRSRAKDRCREYRAEGSERSVAAAIRKEMKLVLGAGTVREISRCDYPTAMKMIGMWDDLDVMMRAGGGL